MGVRNQVSRVRWRSTSPGSMCRFDCWLVMTWVVMVSYAVLGLLALHVAIANHAGGLATSIMDGVDSLGLSRIWELQASLDESRIWMQLMMWGFHPSHGLFSLFFGDSWPTLYLDLLYSLLAVLAGGFIVFFYSRQVLADSRTSFLLVFLYFLLPVTFANTVYWYGQPVFVMVMGAMYLLRRERYVPAAILVIWAHGCHPMTAPVFLCLTWASFRMDLKGRPPILPGFEGRDPVAARSWRFSFALFVALSLWTAFLVLMSRLTDSSSTRGLLWDFFSGKLDASALPFNIWQTVFFFLPMLFLPFASLVWIPSIAVFSAYMLFGSQGVVTGFVLPAAGFSMLAAAWFMIRLPAKTRALLAGTAVVAALLVNLLVPWPTLFPMQPEPLTGGIFAHHSWAVQPAESAINSMIDEQIPEGTARCLTSWQIGPVMARRCHKVTTLSFPFRRQEYALGDFLDQGDRGRIADGWWDFILVDIRREAYSERLYDLLHRIEYSGRWEVAGRTGESVLYRRVEP